MLIEGQWRMDVEEGEGLYAYRIDEIDGGFAHWHDLGNEECMFTDHIGLFDHSRVASPRDVLDARLTLMDGKERKRVTESGGNDYIELRVDGQCVTEGKPEWWTRPCTDAGIDHMLLALDAALKLKPSQGATLAAVERVRARHDHPDHLEKDEAIAILRASYNEKGLSPAQTRRVCAYITRLENDLIHILNAGDV